MPTISREALLIDRRQPVLRWSAVFAGVATSVGFWMLLQLLGVGIGLAAVDVDDAGSLRGVGIGTTTWSLITPLIAMFLGGMLAGRLAQTFDRRLAGAHAVVMWAITSIVGICATIWIVSMIAAGALHGGAMAARMSADTTGGDRRIELRDRRDVNGRLRADQDRVDQERVEHHALEAADATGKALATAGLSLLLALASSVIGAALALRRRDHGGRGGRTERTTAPGVPAAPAITDDASTTAPYPATGPAPLRSPPHDPIPR